MNGVVEIDLEDETHTLRFNVFGCAAFNDEVSKLSIGQITAMEMSVLMLYGGMVGNATLNGAPMPTVLDAKSLYAEISELPNDQEIMDKVDEAFRQSKHGAFFVDQLNTMIDKVANQVEPEKKKKKSEKS